MTGQEIAMNQSDDPRTVFDLGFSESADEVREWLKVAPFSGTPRIMRIPSIELLDDVRNCLRQSDSNISRGQLLVVQQRLQQSVATAQQSHLVCGETDTAGNECGGIIDEKVSAFGIYYVCRNDPKHKFQK